MGLGASGRSVAHGDARRSRARGSLVASFRGVWIGCRSIPRGGRLHVVPHEPREIFIAHKYCPAGNHPPPFPLIKVHPTGGALFYQSAIFCLIIVRFPGAKGILLGLSFWGVSESGLPFGHTDSTTNCTCTGWGCRNVGTLGTHMKYAFTPTALSCSKTVEIRLSFCKISSVFECSGRKK